MSSPKTCTVPRLKAANATAFQLKAPPHRYRPQIHTSAPTLTIGSIMHVGDMYRYIFHTWSIWEIHATHNHYTRHPIHLQSLAKMWQHQNHHVPRKYQRSLLDTRRQVGKQLHLKKWRLAKYRCPVWHTGALVRRAIGLHPFSEVHTSWNGPCSIVMLKMRICRYIYKNKYCTLCVDFKNHFCGQNLSYKGTATFYFLQCQPAAKLPGICKERSAVLRFEGIECDMT